jgi:transaldolase
LNPTDKNEQIYKKYKNKLNHVIKTAKKKYYESLLIKHKQNSRMVWKTLNEILNKPNKNTNISKTFIQTNSTDILDNAKEIANKFNHYFVNVGPI